MDEITKLKGKLKLTNEFPTMKEFIEHGLSAKKSELEEAVKYIKWQLNEVRRLQREIRGKSDDLIRKHLGADSPAIVEYDKLWQEVQDHITAVNEANEKAAQEVQNVEEK